MNVSRFSPDDPRLTAYALGELDSQEAAQVEALLRLDPAARQIVDDIRATAAQLEAALASEGIEASEPAAIAVPIRSVGISKDPAVLDLRYARKRMWGGLIDFPQWSQVLSGAAAAALIGFVLFFRPGYQPNDGLRKQLAEEQRARAIAEARNVALREQLDHQKADAQLAADLDGRRGGRGANRFQFQLPPVLQGKPEPIPAEDSRGLQPTLGGLAKLDTFSTAIASADIRGESGGEEDDITKLDPFLAESDEDYFAMVNFANRAPYPMTLANVLDWAKSNIASASDDPGAIHRDISSLTHRADGVMQ